MARDITEQRAAEHRMMEAERLGGIGTWELELVGERMFWSPGLFSILGIDPEIVAPTWERWWALLHPDDRGPMKAELSRALAGDGDQWPSECRVQRADGQLRYVRCMSELTRSGDGEPLRVLGTVHDCTDRAVAEVALERSEANVLQTARMQSLGQLAGGVAHDFNNLLAVILSCTEFVLEDMPADSGSRDDVAEIRKAAQRAADLTRRLLVFSRREIVRPQTVDLGSLVSGLEGLLSRALGENFEFSTDVAEGVGHVSADFGQLEQMVINLTLNARDAMPGGGMVHIEVDAVDVPSEVDVDEELEPGRYVRLRATDTGTGMDPEVASRVFDPFFTTKDKGGGTGLGLATAYGAVHEANGNISVTSRLGLGSIFTILLPVAHDRASPADELPADPSGRTAGSARRVLVVDDDASLRRVVRRILTKAGYNVLEAADAKRAIRVLEECDGDVELLLTDVVMPGASGWELHLQMHERWPRIRTLLMSGYADNLVGRERLIGSDVDFIDKPFAASALLAAVAKQVGPAPSAQPARG